MSIQYPGYFSDEEKEEPPNAFIYINHNDKIVLEFFINNKPKYIYFEESEINQLLSIIRMYKLDKISMNSKQHIHPWDNRYSSVVKLILTAFPVQ